MIFLIFETKYTILIVFFIYWLWVMTPNEDKADINTNSTSGSTDNGVSSLGINCNPDQFRRGTCTRNTNKTLNINTSNTSSNPTLFIQDLVLTATSFVGTMMVVALIVMWWKYVMGGMDESSTGDLKGNIKKLIIGLGLVIGSYTIIRIVQYIAKGF